MACSSGFWKILNRLRTTALTAEESSPSKEDTHKAGIILQPLGKWGALKREKRHCRGIVS